MSHSRKLIASLLITLTTVLLFFFLNSLFIIHDSSLNAPVLSDSIIPPPKKPVDVVAQVGGYIINSITGWTSPYAEVILSSQGLSRKTTADITGFFAFYFVPVPNNLGELCFISQDVNQLPSYPNCLAPPPNNQSLDIKDILLPPSISLESDKIATGKTTKASGRTFPNSEVEVYFFTENNYSFTAWIRKTFPFLNIFSLLTSHFSPSNVYALGLPSYKIKSNEFGSFEFSLPATSPASNRVFATSHFSFGNSPKSNTLVFQSLGFFDLLQMFLKDFFKQAGIFFGTLKDSSYGLILIELGILLAIISAILLKRFKNHKRSASIPACRQAGARKSA